MAASIEVNVRMYRVGELGDCFLLTFKEGTNTSNILIDCGSFRNSSESKARFAAIANHIKAHTKGKKLNAMVGTHQHNDHLSGYVHAQKIFVEEIGAEQVWLPWLDDDEDALAIEIQKKHKKLVGLVDGVQKNLQRRLGAAPSPELQQLHDQVADVMQFYGLADGNVPAQGIAILKSISGKDPLFLSPGQIFDVPGLKPDTVKVHVLGPPRDFASIRDTTPNASESYDHELALANFNAAHLLGAMSIGTEEAEQYPEEDHFPFNRYFKVRENDTQTGERFAQLKNTEVYRRFTDPNEAWRSIEHDWLEPAGALALALNSYTNNSSLVLAFELVRSKKVLLFVGDAQTGNWLSWDKIVWQGGPSNKDKTNELLKNTVLYKVGHHASHNATLVGAFEKMTRRDLAALIPVDDSDPNITKKNGWKMPAHNLYREILKKTNSRVLRMDKVFDIQPGDEAKTKGWKKSVKVDELFIELKISG